MNPDHQVVDQVHSPIYLYQVKFPVDHQVHTQIWRPVARQVDQVRSHIDDKFRGPKDEPR